MKDMQNKIGILREINARRGASFPLEFESALAEIAAERDATSIVPLLGFFEDDHPAEEVLFSIVHTIEAYPDDVYLRELLRGTEELLQRTARWSRILYMRVLNADSTRIALRGMLPQQRRTTQESVRRILEDIRRRRPELAGKAEQVIAALSE